MNNVVSSKVIIPQGLRKYLNKTTGKISIDGGNLIIQSDDGSEILDTSLTSIKKAKIQMGILYVYTSQGMKEVSFKVNNELSDSAVDIESAKWHKAFSEAGIKSSQISLVKSLVVATIVLAVVAIYKILTLILSK